MTVHNTTPMTVVAVQATRQFGVDHCFYIPDRMFSVEASPPPPYGKESVRRLYTEITVRNSTSKWFPVDAGCKYYDKKGLELVPGDGGGSRAGMTLLPGQTQHALTCEFEPQSDMSQGEVIPGEWSRVYHVILEIDSGWNG